MTHGAASSSASSSPVADVVIENFRPGVLERWGLDYESIKELNPRAILSGSPPTGRPDRTATCPASPGSPTPSRASRTWPVSPTGHRSRPGSTSLADYMTGLYGVVGRAARAAGARGDRHRAVRRPRAVRDDVPRARRAGARVPAVRVRPGADGRRHGQRRAAQPLREPATAAGWPSPARTTRCSPGWPRPWVAPSWPATTRSVRRKRAWRPAPRSTRSWRSGWPR